MGEGFIHVGEKRIDQEGTVWAAGPGAGLFYCGGADHPAAGGDPSGPCQHYPGARLPHHGLFRGGGSRSGHDQRGGAGTVQRVDRLCPEDGFQRPHHHLLLSDAGLFPVRQKYRQRLDHTGGSVSLRGLPQDPCVPVHICGDLRHQPVPHHHPADAGFPSARGAQACHHGPRGPAHRLCAAAPVHPRALRPQGLLPVQRGLCGGHYRHGGGVCDEIVRH